MQHLEFNVWLYNSEESFDIPEYITTPVEKKWDGYNCW